MRFNHVEQIVAYDLCSIRSNKRLFENLNFTVHKGNALEIHGMNGTGKTTLLKILSGMVSPSKGEIIINYGNITFNDYKKHIIFLDSSPRFREDISVLDYLIYWTTLHQNMKNISYNYINTILNRLGLDALKNIEISKLSLGQKKRLLLSRLLILNRQIWLLDEPYTGLDQYWILELNYIINAHKQNGGIVFLTTHLKMNDTTNYNLVLD